MPDRRANLPAIVAAFAVLYLVWGSTYLANLAVVAVLPPLLSRAGCCLLAGVLLLGGARAAGAAAPTPRMWLAAIPSAALLFVGCQGVLSLAQRSVPSGLAALLIATVPLWIPLLAWAAPGGARPSARLFVGAGLGLGGVALLGADREGAAADPFWAAAVLLCALSWAAGTVLLRHLPRPGSPLLSAGMGLLLGGAMLVVVGVLAGEAATPWPTALPTSAWAGLGWTVFANYVLAFACYSWLLTVAPAPAVATYAYVNPPIALLLGWWFAGEALTRGLLLAAVPILLAVVLAVAAPAERPRAA